MAGQTVPSFTLSADQVRAALGRVSVGLDGIDTVAHGWIGEILVQAGHVLVTLDMPPELASDLEGMRKAAEGNVFTLPGTISATVMMTAEGGTVDNVPMAAPFGDTTPSRPGEMPNALPDLEAPNAPTPIEEKIEIIERSAEGHGNGIDNLLALAQRKDFPPALSNLAVVTTEPLLDWKPKKNRTDSAPPLPV